MDLFISPLPKSSKSHSLTEMSDDEDGIHKLPGYRQTEGGLFIKKKPKPTDQFQFKIPDIPKSSLLGLDKLAGK